MTIRGDYGTEKSMPHMKNEIHILTEILSKSGVLISRCSRDKCQKIHKPADREDTSKRWI
jgi:hypothetical protein